MLIALLAGLALAVPGELTHTGRVFDDTGAPLDGPHDVTFGIFDAQSGGSSVWTETQSVPFDAGYFAVELGAAGSNLIDTDDLDVSGRLWVSIAVDGNAELPRQPLTSVPYARVAGRAQVATDVEGGTVDASEVRINGTTVIDASGALVGPGAPTDTLAELTCTAGQMAVFDGSGWGCGLPSAATDWTDLTGVPTGFADDVDNDVAGALVCSGGNVLGWNGSLNRWACAPDAVLSESDVDGMVADNGFALTADLASVATSGSYGDLSGAPTLAAVATSGDYGDLSNTPTDADTLATLGCADGEVPVYDQSGSAWSCRGDIQSATDAASTYLTQADAAATYETARDWCYVCYPNGYSAVGTAWQTLPSFAGCSMTTNGGPVRVQMEYSMHITTNHGGMRLVMDPGSSGETIYGNNATYGMDWQSHAPGTWIKRSMTRVIDVPAGTHDFTVQMRAQSGGHTTQIHGGNCDDEYSGFHLFMEELQ